MTRVIITVPDEVAAQARAAGLNLSRFATAALVEELDRRAKVDALDAFFAQQEEELGPIPPDEHAEAASWADRVLQPVPGPRSAERRRS